MGTNNTRERLIISDEEIEKRALNYAESPDKQEQYYRRVGFIAGARLVKEKVENMEINNEDIKVKAKLLRAEMFKEKGYGNNDFSDETIEKFLILMANWVKEQ
jgi:hypothetical protein